jgi:hypothetical protein
MPRAGGGGDRDGDGSDDGLAVSVAIGCSPPRWPEALAALSWGNRRQRTVPVCGSTRWTRVRSQAAKRTSSSEISNLPCEFRSFRLPSGCRQCRVTVGTCHRCVDLVVKI